MDKYSWRFLQIIGNIVLLWWAVSLATSVWVVVPLMIMSIWNFVDGLAGPKDSDLWLVLDILIHILLAGWILTFAVTNWIIFPAILIAVWNNLDGVVRRNW